MTKNTLRICVLSLALELACSCRTPDMSDQRYSVILDRATTRQQLALAVKDLAPVTENADFWSHIANDSTYPVFHRQFCLESLFRRHVSIGMSLTQIAAVLHGPAWLHEENVQEIRSLSGWIPVDLKGGDSVFSISLLPDINQDNSAVYLRFQGSITKGQFFQILKGDGQYDKRMVTNVLNQIGFSVNHR